MSGEKDIRENSGNIRDAWICKDGYGCGRFTLDSCKQDGSQAHVYLTPRGVQYDGFNFTWVARLGDICKAGIKKKTVNIYIRDYEAALYFSSEECAAAFFRCLREAMIGKLPMEDS